MIYTDQAERLRQMVAEMAPRARLIAVTSGKGGVGKSNVAVNLAVLLARRDKRTVLIDSDLALANADVLLNVTPRWNLSHVISGARRLEDIITPGPGGVELIAAASGLMDLAHLPAGQRDALIEAIEQLEQRADFVILDTGAGIGANTVHLAAAADDVLVVATPEPTSITDAYATVKVISSLSETARISLLVNMALSRREATCVYGKIAAVARHFLGLRLGDAGYVLMDEHVGEAVRRRRPFVLQYPRCPASYCMAALGARLASSGPDRPRKEGLLRRMVRMFA
jgi:flagellar biosynthesis protein FlhG